MHEGNDDGQTAPAAGAAGGAAAATSAGHKLFLFSFSIFFLFAAAGAWFARLNADYNFCV